VTEPMVCKLALCWHNSPSQLAKHMNTAVPVNVSDLLHMQPALPRQRLTDALTVRSGRSGESDAAVVFVSLS
jgi:hypothetical protein